MKEHLLKWAGLFLGLLAVNAFATVRYVNINSTNSAPPYADWTTAATNIQDAIDASTDGDTVLVTNGIYNGGGRVMGTDITSNRVMLNNALTVQSVNGPWVTIIQGVYSTRQGSVRCAWLTNNASLIGFTLIGGSSLDGEDGGGVWCASSNALVANCVIVSNTASSQGAAGYQGTYNNCLISSNNTSGLGGSTLYNANLNSCTIVNNGYFQIYQVAITNCIIYSNTITAIVPSDKVAYTCTTPLPSGPGNFTNAPQLFADGVHLLSGSPCIGAGTNVVTGTDIFGHAWANPPSVGCAEFDPSPLISQPAIQFASYPFGFGINASVAASPPLSLTWLLNGLPLQDNGAFTGSQTTNLVTSSLNPAESGQYQLVASNAFGITTSTVANVVIHCVNAAGRNPVSPYLGWDTAATNIQDAINASASGDVVLVTNGIYEFGGQSEDGVSSNRITVNKPISVESVNGPLVTTILGGGATNGTSAVRCAWLTNNALLAGFTLKGGATPAYNVEIPMIDLDGGGVWCASSNIYVENCLIVSNAAGYEGAGIYQGTCYNCLISSNTGASGAYLTYVNNCTIVSNSTFGLIASPFGSSITNCIIYYNRNLNVENATSAAYSCITPLAAGAGNTASSPLLTPDGVHLSSGSPCIHAGTNATIGTDLFGMPWANPPSMGCAEFNPLPTVSVPQIAINAFGFSVGNVTIGGQPPYSFTWIENGVPLQNSGGFNAVQTTNLVSSSISLVDSGSYQLVVSNTYGAVTSAPVQLTIHAVNAAGTNPQAPFLTWATAATDIQDAIEASAPGDIVLVTNGIYDTGGEVINGQTNRAALDKDLVVTSVNGWRNTIIQGAFDPISTNGPAAVRCAWLTNGAVLSGFTLRNGATLNTGVATVSQSGGAIWGASSNALVFNCVLSNNFANYAGGGIAYAELNNSLVVGNFAGSYGGGAFYAELNNCTVQDNFLRTTADNGAGTYYGVTRNSIVLGNLNGYFGEDNFEPFFAASYFYCCSDGLGGLPAAGPSNITSNPQLLDSYHLSAGSPCRAAGSALYSSGVDLDGEPWGNPPSMGCDEFIYSNRIGPLAVNIISESFFYPATNAVAGSEVVFSAAITGLASALSWNFGDGPTVSNVGISWFHEWAAPGVYNVVFTAYNATYPSGVATNMLVVVKANPPQLQPPTISSNGLQFVFPSQSNAVYTVQYTTNLTPPVSWMTLGSISATNNSGTNVFVDTTPTNAARFYRVLAQP